jgi:hypothetical protein
MVVLLCFQRITLAQQNIGIGTTTPNSSALLEVQSTNKGLLIPRVSLLSEIDIVTIPAPPTSLLVYNLNVLLPEGVGFYYWNGSKWNKLIAKDGVTNLAWGINGNAGTSPTTDYIGTTDNTPIVFKTFNTLSGKIDPVLENVSWGKRAGNSFTTGTKNFLGGVEAGYRLTIGERNVFLGYHAGNDTDSGSYNIAIGNEALASNTVDPFLKYYIAIGDHAGYNVPGSASGPTQSEHAGIFIGTAAGYHGTGGIAIGDSASFQYSDYRNIAIGVEALKGNTDGPLNIGIGYKALIVNTTGQYNHALGQFALIDNTTGNFNVAIGNNALDENINGDNNTAIGSNAGFSGTTITDLDNTTAVGSNAKVSTSNTMSFGDLNVDRWAFGITTTTAQHALEVGDSGGNGNGAFLTQGGTWTNTSSISKKEDFIDLNPTDLLQKIKALRIQKWKYIGTDEYHIGPVSEDFYKQFHLGTDDKGISTVDPAGISLAAIQQLIKENDELKKRIEKLEQLITSRR